ncbi:MAG: CvpA family protein [Bacilli bacterium]|nr:CvpA family protein [Bacilli bacterium]MDD4388481.1 CvpA family protein [Bacilli bacterium]
MGKIDWIILILILFFMLLGFIKGFVKGILSTANWVLSLVAPYLLTKPFAGVLMKTSLYTNVNVKVVNWIAAKGETFSQPFDYVGYKEQLTAAISELGLPRFIASLISGGIKLEGAPEGLTLAEVLAPAFSNIIITIIAAVIIIVFFLVIFKIIIFLVSKLFQKGVLGGVNRILGGVLGFVKAVIIVSILMLLASAVSGLIPALNEFLIKDLRLEAAGFGIGKFFYEHNPLIEMLKGSFSFDNIFT